jgi:CheY-like chemotaxis protein
MLMNNEFLVEHIAPGRQFQILIVEDDEELLDYLGLLLQDLYTVYSASNVAQALETLDNQRIDMIISDINMPVLNGFDLLNEVRQRHQNLVPFLFLTAIT